MDQISINVKDILELAKKDENTKKALENLFPKVFEKEKEDSQPFCKIGAILKRRGKESTYTTMYLRKTGKVILINITNGYIFTNTLSVMDLKDGNRKTLTKSEFNFISREMADEYEEMVLVRKISSKPAPGFDVKTVDLRDLMNSSPKGKDLFEQFLKGNHQIRLYSLGGWPTIVSDKEE